MKIEICRRKEVFKAIEVRPETINDIYNIVDVHVDLRNFLGCWVVIEPSGLASLYHRTAFNEIFEIVEVYP